MSQERWDVQLRFLGGPLAFSGTRTERGPVIRIGANPGPGGLKTEGYRGIDDRHAVITCYDGGSVSIAPVGGNPVRVGPTEYVAWEELQPIQKPVYLSEGNAVHLGPLARGCSFEFVGAQRLGVWEQGHIASGAPQMALDVSDAAHDPSGTVDPGTGVPKWFIPAMVCLFMFTVSGVGLKLFGHLIAGTPDPLGVTMEGREYVASVDLSEPIEEHLIEGLNQPFSEFVMKHNAELAGEPRMRGDPTMWDQRFLEYVTRSFKAHGRMQAFWKRIDAVRKDYGYVVRQLRQAGLPEVFAAIPYQESRYTAEITSKACAEGYWQFLPEAAKRANVEVSSCSFRGTNTVWSPTRLVPVINVMKRAPYVQNQRCRITSCKVDERQELAASTRGAVWSLAEAYEDRLIRSSGAAVQLTILSHNAGYDNSRYEERRVNRVNILPAYKRHLKDNNLNAAPDFYGDNLTCVDLKETDYDSMSATCGGVLWNHTQHYAYNIVAQHFLAVCYYAKNYANENSFSPWKQWARGNNYCEQLIEVPTKAEVDRW